MSFASTPPDFDDIQCLLRTALDSLKGARYLLLRVQDPKPAGRWLSQVELPTAGDINRKQVRLTRAMQIALSAPGLQALRLAPELIAQFSPEFVTGMAGEENRSRRLGDIGANAPEQWQWGAPSVPHVLVLLFAGEKEIDDWCRTVTGELTASGFVVEQTLDTSDLQGHEPFGFVDGVSQPVVDWKRELPCVDRGAAKYRNLIALGEFVLGYENEYGQFTSRPLLKNDATADLPETLDPEFPGQKDLGKNGTYLVFRRLAQDVRLFWQTMDREAGGQRAEREQLAGRIVGRHLNDKGRPLVGGDPKNFTFDTDPHGLACPFGAHIRRANPRTADIPPGISGWFSRLLLTLGFAPREGVRGDLVASSRFHRLLRRGREFGPKLEPADAVNAAPQTEKERGINFIALGANISRQFEFVQSAWLSSTTFNGLVGESDPLVGTRERTTGCPFDGNFTFQTGGPVRRRITLPQFVTTRGGAYFFMPGLRALRYIGLSAQGLRQSVSPPPPSR